MNQRV